MPLHLHSLAVLVALALAPIILPMSVFGLAERLWPAGPIKTARGWVFNLEMAAAYLAVPTLLGGASAAIVAWLRGINDGGLLNLDFDMNGPWYVVALGCVAFLLAWDFFYYWWHRAQHRAPLLWEMHKLHHLDETLGVSSQMRVHWLEEFGRLPAIVIPLALVFDLPIHAGIVAFVLTGWTAFIHANLRIELGPLSPVLAGPQLHRIHHSRDIEHIGRNYAALFPLWDVMFGTYHSPRRGEFPLTGIEGCRDTHSVTYGLLMPFLAWSRSLSERSRAKRSAASIDKARPSV